MAPTHMTVRDILLFPVFYGAEVVAGHGGLDRRVTGVNVMEVPEVAQWLQGGELLLTAAYALSREPHLCQTLVPSLAKRNVAALVIKRSPYLLQVPQTMLTQAEEFSLPIVIIPSHIPYFQIMDAILANIYSRQLYLLKRSHDIHRKFAAEALRDVKPSRVAHILADLCAHEVFLEDQVEGLLHYVGRLGQRSVRLSAVPEEIEQAFRPYFSLRPLLRGGEPPGHGVICQGQRAIVGWLEGGGACLGLLLMIEGRRGFGELDPLAFGHAVVLASFALMQEKAVKEALARKDAELVEAVLTQQGPPNGSALAGLAQRLGQFSTVGVVYMGAPGETDLVQASARFEHLLRVRGWRWVASLRGRKGLYLAASRDDATLAEQALARMLGMLAGVKVGVSRLRSSLMELSSAFREAQVALQAAERLDREAPVFYGKLGAERLLAEAASSPALREMVTASLGPLLAPTDANRELLRTLRVFLDSGGNKEKAARELFVHRTTLLYRLRKISKLLGKDIEEPSTRLDLQIAVRALDLMEKLGEGGWL